MILTQNVISRFLFRGCNCRAYTLSCPPRTPPGGCGCGGRKPAPPQECRPTRIAPNPCCPKFPEGHDSWKKYRSLFFFFLLPVIFCQSLNALGGHCAHPKGECREYEYMRRRIKRFPWGDGSKTFFHNDEVNHLPGDCTPAPLECD